MSNVIIPLGKHPYDIVVGAATRQAPIATVRQLRALYPQDFEAAASSLHAEEWRLLYAVHHFAIYELVDPAFDPICELMFLFDQAHILESARHVQLGTDCDVEDIVTSIRISLNTLTSDQLKAFWCIMVGAKQSDMSGEELRTKPWWEGWRTM